MSLWFSKLFPLTLQSQFSHPGKQVPFPRACSITQHWSWEIFYVRNNVGQSQMPRVQFAQNPPAPLSPAQEVPSPGAQSIPCAHSNLLGSAPAAPHQHRWQTQLAAPKIHIGNNQMAGIIYSLLSNKEPNNWYSSMSKVTDFFITCSDWMLFKFNLKRH